MNRFNWKTGAKKTEYNGIVYDSKLEANYAEFLDELVSENEIQAWGRQKKFPLLNMYGESRLSYKADFIVTDLQGAEHVVETKGRMSPVDVIKYGYVKYVHNIDILLVNCNYNSKSKRYNFERNSEHMPWLTKGKVK